MHPKRVTLSTVGLVPQMDRLAQEELMPNLAVSLHAATEEQRAAIVPPSKKYTMQDVIDACKRFPLSKRRRIMFEYVMLAGINDSDEDARKLVKVLSGVKAKVNLLPLNAAPGIPFERPSDERINKFAKILADKGLMVSVRKSRGRDIRAACGQLIVEGPVRQEICGAKAGRRAMTVPRFQGSRVPWVWFCAGVPGSRVQCRAADVEGSAVARRRPRRRGARCRHREVRRLQGRESDHREPDAPDFPRQGQGRRRRRASSATSTAGRRRRRATTCRSARRRASRARRGRISKARRTRTRGWSTCFFYDKEAVPDPLNQRTVQAFAGPRSEVRMPFWVAQPEVDELGSAPKGELIAETFDVAIARRQAARVVLPAARIRGGEGHAVSGRLRARRIELRREDGRAAACSIT